MCVSRRQKVSFFVNELFSLVATHAMPVKEHRFHLYLTWQTWARSMLTNSQVGWLYLSASPGQKFNSLFHKRPMILLVGWPLLLPTILLTDGRILTFSYVSFNVNRFSHSVSQSGDEGRHFTSIPTIFQTLLPSRRSRGDASARNLSQDIYDRPVYRHRDRICCISDILGVVMESTCSSVTGVDRGMMRWILLPSLPSLTDFWNLNW